MSSFQVTGTNSQAPFTLTIHRGDGMGLLAMNWKKGRPPRDVVGFAIEFKEPGDDKFWAIRNVPWFLGPLVPWNLHYDAGPWANLLGRKTSAARATTAGRSSIAAISSRPRDWV